LRRTGRPVIWASARGREEVETLCLDFLGDEHDGWENNDGAEGTFEFNVADRTIQLVFNSRWSEVTTPTHDL